MAWIGPSDCEDNCCEPPCVPPVITCYKYDSPYGGGFDYTVTDADYAWITETCDGVVTNHVVTLSGGNASGTFSTDDTCQYCIRARKGDCEAACCDVCDTPTCSMSVSRNSSGDIVVVWGYTGSESDRIVSAVVGGIDVFGDDITDSGTITDSPSSFTYVPNYIHFAAYGLILYDLVLTITNDCGKVTECRFTMPCCWVSSQLRITITGITDINFDQSESLGPPGRAIGGFVYFQRQIRHRLQTTGLSAINGTYLFDLAPNASQVASSGSYCAASQYLFHLGTITIDEKVDSSGVSPTPGLGVPVRNYTFFRYMDTTIDAYFGFGALGWGIYFEFADMNYSEELDVDTAFGFNFTNSATGFSDNMAWPWTHPGTSDGTYAPLVGFGFFVDSVPLSLGPTLPIQRQPDLYCGRGSVTRDFWAPAGDYQLPDFSRSIAAWGGPYMDLTGVRVPPTIFPDAVTLEIL